jgi:uncharacterized membrane protein YphA (DoxX/SURF4 family)
MQEIIIKIVSCFLVLMFIISGLSKTITLGKSESSRFSVKLSKLLTLEKSNTLINENIGQVLVFIAGIWELVSCIILIYGIFTLNSKFIFGGSLSLIIFTILATIIFYVFPFKHLPILSNLTTICALILLPFICLYKK